MQSIIIAQNRVNQYPIGYEYLRWRRRETIYYNAHAQEINITLIDIRVSICINLEHITEAF